MNPSISKLMSFIISVETPHILFISLLTKSVKKLVGFMPSLFILCAIKLAILVLPFSVILDSLF